MTMMNDEKTVDAKLILLLFVVLISSGLLVIMRNTTFGKTRLLLNLGFWSFGFPGFWGLIWNTIRVSESWLIGTWIIITIDGHDIRRKNYWWNTDYLFILCYGYTILVNLICACIVLPILFVHCPLFIVHFLCSLVLVDIIYLYIYILFWWDKLHWKPSNAPLFYLDNLPGICLFLCVLSIYLL